MSVLTECLQYYARRAGRVIKVKNHLVIFILLLGTHNGLKRVTRVLCRSTIFKTERFVTAEVSVLARLSVYDNLFMSAARNKCPLSGWKFIENVAYHVDKANCSQ